MLSQQRALRDESRARFRNDLVESASNWWLLEAVGGTAVTLRSGVRVITLLYAVYALTGTDAAGGTVTLEAGDSINIYNDGVDVLTAAVSAGGVATIQRTAGADTFDVNMTGVWV